MNNRKEQICQCFIESLIDDSIVDQNLEIHSTNCESCRNIKNTVACLKELDSAYGSSSEIVNLQKRVMNRLVPLLPSTNKITAKKTESASWMLWITGLAFAMLLFIVLTFSNRQTPGEIYNKSIQQLPIVAGVESQSFLISLNNREPITVSMDNPVSLFENERAVIKLPDKSEIVLAGPARMTLKPRGFHLINGKATATVKPDKKKFTATTIHGKVEVLGTIFSCEASNESSKVSVIQGSVKVTDNTGRETVLSAGENTTLTADSSNENDTEEIPKISQE